MPQSSLLFFKAAPQGVGRVSLGVLVHFVASTLPAHLISFPECHNKIILERCKTAEFRQNRFSFLLFRTISISQGAGTIPLVQLLEKIFYNYPCTKKENAKQGKLRRAALCSKATLQISSIQKSQSSTCLCLGTQSALSCANKTGTELLLVCTRN